MAKIVQALTRASAEYDQKTFQSLVRDLETELLINLTPRFKKNSNKR